MTLIVYRDRVPVFTTEDTVIPPSVLRSGDVVWLSPGEYSGAIIGTGTINKLRGITYTGRKPEPLSADELMARSLAELREKYAPSNEPWSCRR